MSIRRKVGQLRALVAAAILAASTLALPVSTPPAHAAGPCEPAWQNAVSNWSVSYDDRGVTLCHGHTSSLQLTHAFVHIIDMEAGAKVRLLSDFDDPAAFPAADVRYKKRSASSWFTWIQNNGTTGNPGTLFSTTNASFFTDTSSATTPLSLPQTSTQYYSSCPPPFSGPGACSVAHLSTGWALDHNSDPAWDAPKRALLLGPTSSAQQSVWMDVLPTHYDMFDVFNLLGGSSSLYDGTVAFPPEYPISGPGTSRRNFVGMKPDGSKVYILTTARSYTIGEAQDILKSFGSVLELQLDGGGSAQMYYRPPGGSGHHGVRSIIDREVPDVLAVFLAPN